MAKHTIHDIRIAANGKFDPDPLEDVKSGDCVRLIIPSKKIVTITVEIDVKPGGGGGGPIIITS
jgi:hypothetical protein